jgi:hypothetical protein
MALLLSPHPATPPSVALSLSVGAERSAPGTLELVFSLEGAVENIRLPELGCAERADGLWRHTCFEAFVRAGEGEAYHEVNLSPSRAWAAYRFDDYRAGMAVASIEPLETEVLLGKDELVLVATLVGFPDDAAWHVGLSAVIEEKDGGISYWALRHPPGAPDFHHRDCFALELAPPARS